MAFLRQPIEMHFKVKEGWLYYRHELSDSGVNDQNELKSSTLCEISQITPDNKRNSSRTQHDSGFLKSYFILASLNKPNNGHSQTMEYVLYLYDKKGGFVCETFPMNKVEIIDFKRMSSNMSNWTNNNKNDTDFLLVYKTMIIIIRCENNVDKHDWMNALLSTIGSINHFVVAEEKNNNISRSSKDITLSEMHSFSNSVDHAPDKTNMNTKQKTLKDVKNSTCNATEVQHNNNDINMSNVDKHRTSNCDSRVIDYKALSQRIEVSLFPCFY